MTARSVRGCCWGMRQRCIDSAYSSRQTRHRLKRFGIGDQVQRQGYRNHPLSEKFEGVGRISVSERRNIRPEGSENRPIPRVGKQRAWPILAKSRQKPASHGQDLQIRMLCRGLWQPLSPTRLGQPRSAPASGTSSRPARGCRDFPAAASGSTLASDAFVREDAPRRP